MAESKLISTINTPCEGTDSDSLINLNLGKVPLKSYDDGRTVPLCKYLHMDNNENGKCNPHLRTESERLQELNKCVLYSKD